MCPISLRSVHPPFATIELVREVAVVSLTGSTPRLWLPKSPSDLKFPPSERPP
jgi:hypothetical protein